MRKLNKKIVIAAAAVAVVAVGGGTAFAYWTTTGSGSGTASTTAGNVNTLSFSQNTLSAMYPGDASQALTVAVTNTGSQDAYVTGVKAYITTDKAGCTGGDFLLNSAAAPSDIAGAVSLAWTGQDLAKTTGTANATGTIQFNNTSANQDVCKSAAVTLHYASN